MKKKAFYLIGTFLLASGALFGCSTGSNTQSSSNGGTTSSEKKDEGPKKTITYRSWDYGTAAQNNEERQLIKAFEEKENVIVKVVENPGTTEYWTNVLSSVVDKVDLADVFMLTSVPDALKVDGLLLNIKNMTDADAEFAKVPASVKDACAFKSGVYAVPARMHMQGYFLNTKIIENNLNISCRNIDANSSWSKLEEIIDKAYTVDGIIGLDKATQFPDLMPSMLDSTGQQGYFTWDGSAYHLDEEPFIQSVQKAQALFNAKKTLDAYTDDEKTDMGIDISFEQGYVADAWNKGKLAIRYGATYQIADMLQYNSSNYTYKFIGNPGGKTSIVGDYFGIYSGTEEPELAYKFAKWMSFGMDGFKKKMDIYEANESIPNSLPMQDDEDLIADYFDRFGSSTEVKGLQEAYDRLAEHSMVEAAKVVPNFFSSRQSAVLKNVSYSYMIGDTECHEEDPTMFTLINDCCVHSVDITNYTSDTFNINTIANNQYKGWMKTYGNKYE